MKEFDYLKLDESQSTLCTADSTMMMNITVERLQNETLEIYSEEEETAIVLLEGNVAILVECPVNGSYVVKAKRENPIDHPGYCLHVPRYAHVSINLLDDSPNELLVQATKNDREFPSQFYTPENTRVGNFGEGQFEGKALRRVTTYFDIHNAPYSNMVCGEIMQPQGGWSSYPPHEHPHPEVYYYRFSKPQGFGACFLDDDVYKIRDRSFAAIEGGKYHPQVTAPGYAMMYVWMIRHFDGYPWDERNFHPEHQWLLD